MNELPAVMQADRANAGGGYERETERPLLTNDGIARRIVLALGA